MQSQGCDSVKQLAAFVLDGFFEGLVALRTQDLIPNLFDLNVVERFAGKIERCDAGRLLKQCVEDYHFAAAEKQVVFLCGISDQLWTLADRTVLRRIFDNVISNSVKYSPINSAIQVHALIENGSIVINVRDQGMGINESRRQKLFQRFCDLLANTPAHPHSTAPRMPMIKKVAEALSGSVRWRNALGSGSTFTLKLPFSIESGAEVNVPHAQSPDAMSMN